jgi:RNA polymerase sigma-70 factor (ECF subfamily)
MVEVLPRLRRFAFMLSGDMDRAEDLTQEACMRALANAEQWTAGTRLDSWMYKIAQNLWYDRMRATKVRGITVELDDALNVAGDDGRQVGDGRLQLAEVLSGIERLTPEQQLLLTMVCVDGLSYREAARSLDVPIGTVMSRLARARKALHEYMENGSMQASRETGSKRA